MTEQFIETLRYYHKRLEEALRRFKELKEKYKFAVNWIVGYCFDCDEILEEDSIEEHRNKNHFIVIEFDTNEIDEEAIHEISTIKRFIEYLLKIKND